MSKETKDESTIALKEQLKKDADRRAQSCFAEIQASLKKFNCEMVPSVHIINNSLSSNIDIVSKPLHE